MVPKRRKRVPLASRLFDYADKHDGKVTVSEGVKLTGRSRYDVRGAMKLIKNEGYFVQTGRDSYEIAPPPDEFLKRMPEPGKFSEPERMILREYDPDSLEAAAQKAIVYALDKTDGTERSVVTVDKLLGLGLTHDQIRYLETECYFRRENGKLILTNEAIERIRPQRRPVMEPWTIRESPYEVPHRIRIEPRQPEE